MTARVSTAAPSSGLRHRGQIRETGHAGRTAHAAPVLKPGQRRCPVCRNGARVGIHGHLYKHKDLFGHACYNKKVTL